jgi:hypothetical protein
MSTMDYNTDNYTITELLAILNLNDPTEKQIIDTTNKLIDRFTNEKSPNLVGFFQNIQTKLLQYTNQLKKTGNTPEYKPNTEQNHENPPWICIDKVIEKIIHYSLGFVINSSLPASIVFLVIC